MVKQNHFLYRKSWMNIHNKLFYRFFDKAAQTFKDFLKSISFISSWKNIHTKFGMHIWTDLPIIFMKDFVR